VPRRRDHLPGGSLLDHLPGAHDRHPVAQLGDDGQVVADEQDGHAAGVTQLAQQLEHFGLHGHVQGAGRLVGQQHLGAQREGERDRDPLQLPAGQLRRVAVQQLRREQHAAHGRVGPRRGLGGGQAVLSAASGTRSRPPGTPG
jgi:hypothetical protein